jgi:hypothetical protein
VSWHLQQQQQQQLQMLAVAVLQKPMHLGRLCWSVVALYPPPPLEHVHWRQSGPTTTVPVIQYR